MAKKTGIIFVTIGVALILSALLLFGYNRYEEDSAGQEAELLLENMQNVIAGRKAEDSFSAQGGITHGGDIREKEGTSNGTEKENTYEDAAQSEELPVVNMNGYDYIGYLSIPSLNLDLPVMSDWDYKRLKKAPCRQCGSTRTDNLVIAAHNYKTHFGSLSKLEVGAEISFTDMDGTENDYVLERLESMMPDAVDAVVDSDYDLVLYTCTPGGKSRVVAFCNRVAKAN